MAEEQLVFAYCDGTVFSFERAQGPSASTFGGPMEVTLSGVAHGPKPLHMVAQLSAMHLCGTPNQEAIFRRLFDVPLIYGMCYDGCGLEYRVDAGSKVELLRLRPTQSSDDWPYPNYPSLLPYVPLQVSATRSSSYEEFAQSFPNMPEQPTELVVVVPSPATLGVSLWGKWGDNVIILFECDLEDRIIYASNQCD
jgi:hypothetical protein